jgi:hypothetical protein
MNFFDPRWKVSNLEIGRLAVTNQNPRGELPFRVPPFPPFQFIHVQLKKSNLGWQI